MKVSRSTSRPRRAGRHGAGGTMAVLVALVTIAGALGYIGNSAGWWSFGGDAGRKEPPKPPPRGAAPESAPHEAAASRTPESSIANASTGNASGSRAAAAAVPSMVPAGGPFVIPRFGKEFEDALARGAFKEAEAALAKIGGAADAERRLAASMSGARARIAGRFTEIREASGERAARVYLTHQLVNFPERAEDRRMLEALLAISTERPPATEVAAVPTGSSSRPAPRSEAPAPAARPAGDLIGMMDEAARVLEAGEIKAALSVLREVATAAEAAQERTILADARRLVRQGEAELRFRQAVVDRVAQKVPGDRTISHLPGEKGRILDASQEGVTFASQKGQVTLKWRVMPVHVLSAMIPVLELGPADLVDAGSMLYRAGHVIEADALLVAADRAGGAGVKDAIDQTLADARGMAVPPGGFRLAGDKWVSPQEAARQDITREIAKSTKDLAAADPASRRAAFTAMMKLGDAAKSPLHRALMLRRSEIREELQGAATHGKLKDLAEKRKELDDARSHALELIEDEIRYPYPYNPPEASPEQQKAFNEAQREIDTRVAKLRSLWNQQATVSLPKAFTEKVALLAEIAGFLAELGTAPADPDPAWLVFLPAGEEVTLRTIATSEADRRRIDDSIRTMHENATRATKSTPGELHQARATNDYRVMLGRAALLVHDQLTAAAHGHCDDMAKRGFFAHMSPIAGKTTPYDRVRLTGMRPMGVSENIAQAHGPDDAHNGWCHSSGHHRNLVAAGWKLIGVGSVGSLWCQNFTAGEVPAGDAGGFDDEDGEGR